MTEIIITRGGVIVPFGSSKEDNAPVLKAMQVGRVCGWTTQGLICNLNDTAKVVIRGVKDAQGRRERFAARVVHELAEVGIPAVVVVR